MKINVLNNIACVTSSLPLDSIKRVQKYKPEALKVFEGEGDAKEVVFKLAAQDGIGSISNMGITFGMGTREDGLATLTTDVDYKAHDVKEWLADKYGAAFRYLKELEEKLPAVIDGINADRDAIMANIDVQ